MAGVKNLLNVQVYLLTDFWEAVKDAHPVMFTLIRDGVPLYDRGTFMPWKALLKMGKLKPSPEAIDMFMSMGDKVDKRVKRTMLDLVMGDIYWGVLTPSQALLMLYGLPPPNVKETVKQMKSVFVDKEKMLEKKYIDILEKICIKYYKGYEHEKVKEVSGKEVDELLKDMNDYLKRLKELREQIEKRTSEKTIEDIYKDVFELLESVVGKKSLEKTVSEDFLRKFDIVLSENDYEKGKPEPEPYLTAIKRLNLKPEECVVIENAPLGIESAKSAGAYCIALTTTLSREYLSKADVILNNHQELFHYIRHEFF